jgi:hypothetical protein
MFVGHFGVGFAAKRIAPAAGLGTLFLGAQFLDLLWPSLLLVGWESVAIAPGITAVTPLDFRHYPISHSLLAVAGWSIVVGGAYFAMTDRWREALVVAALVASHWFLDAIVHRPDLPLTPLGPERIGLGLWNSLPLTLAVEVPIFIGGCWLYARATRARDWIGRWGFAGLVSFLVLVYVANLAGDPPPSVEAIAWAGHAQWLLVLWAAWVDRHREARP